MGWNSDPFKDREAKSAEYNELGRKHAELLKDVDDAKQTLNDAKKALAVVEASIEEEACDKVYEDGLKNIGKKPAEKEPLKWPTAYECKNLRETLKHSGKHAGAWQRASAAVDQAEDVLRRAESALSDNEYQSQRCRHILDGIAAENLRRATDESKSSTGEITQIVAALVTMFPALATQVQAMPAAEALQEMAGGN